MQGSPVTLRILRWEVSVGGILPMAETGTPTIRFVDAGALTARSVTGDAGADTTEPVSFDFTAGRSLDLPKVVDPRDLVIENTGAEPAIVFELRVEPGPSA